MTASFPQPGDDATVRRMIERSVSDDGLGLGTRSDNGRVLFRYPAAVVAGAVSP